MFQLKRAISSWSAISLLAGGAASGQTGPPGNQPSRTQTGASSEATSPTGSSASTGAPSNPPTTPPTTNPTNSPPGSGASTGVPSNPPTTPATPNPTTSPPESRSSTGVPSNPPAPSPTTPTNAIRDDERRLIVKLHHVIQKQVEMANLAKDKAENSEVKVLAAKIVKDHAKADGALQSFAKDNSIVLNEPSADPDHQKNMATLADLKELNGSAFDRRFLAAIIGGHDRVVRQVTQARQNTSNPKLSALLNGLLPTLKEHRDEAMKLKGGQASARSARHSRQR